MESGPRICSLLPSATEIVYALGLGDQLIAVTHECDYPPEAQGKPRVTRSVIDSHALSAREIDEAVRDSLADQATIYHLDRNLLDELRPDVILTQELCAVCAVGAGEVRAVVESLSGRPQVVSLEPRTLHEVLDTILRIGRLTGTLRRALDLRDALQRRVEDVRDRVSGHPMPRVLTLEWTDPPFVGGHWVPEMVSLAGGIDVLAIAGEWSREVSWEEIEAAVPEVIVAMPCGFGLERSREELLSTAFPPGWESLPAVVNDGVFVVDGSSYFNRPGPRLIDGVEILATILHPDLFEHAPAGSFARVSTLGSR